MEAFVLGQTLRLRTFFWQQSSSVRSFAEVVLTTDFLHSVSAVLMYTRLATAGTWPFKLRGWVTNVIQSLALKVYARPLLLLSAILACPGQSSVFRLMPKLAGGYGGGSIKITLYDPCFRSTTVVQGFPAEYSFHIGSPGIFGMDFPPPRDRSWHL